MNEAWPTVKLGDIAEVTSSKRIKMADYVKSGVPFYRSKEIIERSKGNSISTELFITEEYFSAIDQKFGSPSQGDILLTSVGTLGIPYQVKEGDRFYFKDGNLTWFRNYKPDIDADFLLCWLTSSIAKRRFDEVTIGSTQKALTIIALKSIDITLPPLAEQKSIASVLGALDDKIENSRRMNETLEEMARAIFKSWFVDFDPVHAKAAGNAPAHMDAETAALFPSSFGDDGLPVGWHFKKLEDISDLGWGDLSTTKKSYVDAGFDAYSASGKDGKLPHFDFEKLGVVLSAIGANSGKTWLARGKWSCIKNTIRFWSEYELTPTVFLFHSTNGPNFWPLRGSAQPFISQGDARSQKIIVPSNGEAISFERIVGRYYEKISANEAENQTLAELRDTLLPKLMSGEIRVADAENEVEAAV